MEGAKRRLYLLERHFTQNHDLLQGSENVLEFLGLENLFPSETNHRRTEIRKQLEQNAELVQVSYERAQFPDELKALIKRLEIFGVEDVIEGVRTVSTLQKCAYAYELARFDASLFTFFAVQQSLVITSVKELASVSQKQKYLPLLCNLDMIGGWALSEPDIGSDASSLELTADPIESGFRLNGYKKWIGNASISSILIVFARNTASKKVIGLIVETQSPGIQVEDIKHKLALRIVKNGLIEFKSVFVPASNLLEKATDFASGPNVILGLSRLSVVWAAVGLMAGAYENVIHQLKTRPDLTGLDMRSVQEKLNRMLSFFQGSFLMVYHLTQRMAEGKLRIGEVSFTKAEATRSGREVVRLASEILREEGLKLENYTIKAIADMEVFYTYEGSFDVNVLVAGRELTGIASIKPPFKLP